MRRKGRKKTEGEKQAGGDSAFALLKENASSAYSAIYQRLPSLPLLGKGYTALFIAIVLAYACLFAYALFTIPKPEITGSVVEGALSKNSQLALMPGEKYAYEFEIRGKPELAEYGVFSVPGCGGVAVEETLGASSIALCLLANGLEQGGKASNMGYENATMLVFAPWMLAVSGNFSWRVDTEMGYQAERAGVPSGAIVEGFVLYSSRGKRDVAGREAYAIAVGTAPFSGEQTMLYVDAQKRVLLLAESGNATVRLVEAPFPLNWGGG